MSELFSKRRSLKKIFALSSAAGFTILLGPQELAYGASLVGVRVWPADDYTRVTLESDTALHVSHQLLTDPNRLVVDIEGLDLNPKLRELVAKVQTNDPYIAQVRVGQFQPKIVRLVFDLKDEIKPQLFTLDPIGNYQYRLVFDLYPKVAPDLMAEFLRKNISKEEDDPIAALVLGNQNKKIGPTIAEPQKYSRIVTIAIDAGHGGEDPGAIGQSGAREKDVVLSIARRLKNLLYNGPA